MRLSNMNHRKIGISSFSNNFGVVGSNPTPVTIEVVYKEEGWKDSFGVLACWHFPWYLWIPEWDGDGDKDDEENVKHNLTNLTFTWDGWGWWRLLSPRSWFANECWWVREEQSRVAGGKKEGSKLEKLFLKTLLGSLPLSFFLSFNLLHFHPHLPKLFLDQ